ncbi:magnesium and cobalt transport protein [Stemphylium lycopersici]|uniref:Magnesium and cobalt transport protein n=1 Tax=Stemphylium lycopersici TaxID=183478 RepID=A0A364N820_STELY|nr:magnesium and cobalt transport protein [Stemphylium lycopersici]RAR13432.1 magnesium and cobalt transport protein [Stemphylium lycopersici]
MGERQSPTGTWIDRSATLCEKDIREAYHELIDLQLRSLYPDFFRNLYVQTPKERERGRVAVIEYQDDEIPDPEVFKNSQDVKTHFDNPIAANQSGPRKRLFVLEDLSLSYVEALGSRLRIPPSFFAAHWADPATPAFNQRNPLRRYAKGSFVIRYPSTQPLRVDADPDVHGHVFRCDFNLERHIYCYDPKALLIVDPPVRGKVRSLTDERPLSVDHHSNEYAYSRMNSLDPEFNDVDILSPDPTEWTKGWQRPQYVSMFDDIVSLEPDLPAREIGPRTCTNVARKLAICSFLSFLRRRILNMLRLQANLRTTILHVNRCDYLREFGFVVNVKYIMGLVSSEAKEHFEVLGLHRHNADDVPEWERDGWIAVQDYCGKIINMADAFLQSYPQFTSMQEAQAANKNALNLAHITSLTMVFVPLSTIAAIFSMTDDFLPGEKKS